MCSQDHSLKHLSLGTIEFNVQLKTLGLYQTGADAYFWSGANKWNHADTDAFTELPLWEQMTVGRMYIYDSTYSRLPSSGQIMVNDLTTSSADSPGCSGKPLDRVKCIDYVVGTQYLMGSMYVVGLWCICWFIFFLFRGDIL